MTTTLPVFVLGDGHTRYLVSANWHKLFAPRKIEVCEVAGATAAANINPGAPADALIKFRKFIGKRRKDSIVVIHMGEADCDTLISHGADKFNATVMPQLDQAIAAYFEFVDELINKGFKNIIIAGASLPTIADQEQPGGIVESPDDITITQHKKTDLTLAYNACLKEQAEKRHLLYTDITEAVLDPETGLAHSHFRNENPAERIMNVRMAGPLWAIRLNACFESLDPLHALTCAFTATGSSFAKGLALYAKEIPPHLKITTRKNDQLVAKLQHDTGEFFVISDGVLNGQPLGGLIRLIHKAAWKRDDLVDDAAQPVAEPAPAKPEPFTAAPAEDIVAETIAAPPPAEDIVAETIAVPPAVNITSRLASAKARVFGKRTKKQK